MSQNLICDQHRVCAECCGAFRVPHQADNIVWYITVITSIRCDLEKHLMKWESGSGGGSSGWIGCSVFPQHPCSDYPDYLCVTIVITQTLQCTQNHKVDSFVFPVAGGRDIYELGLCGVSPAIALCPLSSMQAAQSSCHSLLCHAPCQAGEAT